MYFQKLNFGERGFAYKSEVKQVLGWLLRPVLLHILHFSLCICLGFYPERSTHVLPGTSTLLPLGWGDSQCLLILSFEQEPPTFSTWVMCHPSL